jgi:uncharacterized membrane protein
MQPDLNTLDEVRQINETLSIQIWVIGGVAVFMLALLTYFSKNSYEEIKEMLQRHDEKITKNSMEIVELKASAKMSEHIDSAADKISTAINEQRDVIVAKIRAITPKRNDIRD